jgi:type II secretory ATPase GspE/PulE/Tfp pilus assembly ATPase PilB-like protein
MLTPSAPRETPLYRNFEWPLPHYYEALPPQSADEREPATLHLLDGRTIEGALTRFLPSHGVVEFAPRHERTNANFQLTEIEQLRLTRPVKLQARADMAEIEKRGQVAKPSERQSFRVELVNGKVLAEETTGFDMQESGLFLFIPAVDHAVLRTFIPASSIKSEQIGPLIGRTLVEQKIVGDRDIGHALRKQQELREQKLGELLTEKNLITHAQLHAALERERSRPVARLGEALIELKMLARDQLSVALEVQRENRTKPLGEILLDLGYISKEQLYNVLSQKLGIPSVDLSRFQIEPAVLKALPEDLVHRCRVVPLCHDRGSLVVAMTNPFDAGPVEQVRFYTQGQVIPVMATSGDINLAIETYYGAAPGESDVEKIADELRSEAAATPGLPEVAIKETDNALVRLVNKMIVDAHAVGASDIHVESNAGRSSMLIRFRKDGVLSEYLRLPHNFRNATVSRIKIMAGLDISEHRRAQDGRINFQHFGPARVELRVVIIPTQDGLEDVVMRLLRMGEPLPLSRLGLRDSVLAGLQRLLDKPHGLILAVGPTGSGKTTTLHSLISVLNVPGIKIWTAENPVEITQPGLRQVQVNPRIGWTFATVMRAFLRADPDVIMVGEMRDQETAGIAIEASLTGHLVFSTLHTNSAAETVVRLLDMGIDPFSFTDSLLGVLAQRLARRLCLACRVSRPAAKQDVAALAQEYCHETDLNPTAVVAEWHARFGDTLTIHEAAGCPACRKTGYAGRIGLHELFEVTPQLRQMVLRRASAAELRDAAIAGGMRTLKQDGIEKCLAGDTDIHEVRAAAT